MNEFRLQDLTTIENGKITAAFSPAHAARAVCEADGVKLHGIVRIWFNDELVNNRYEGKTEKGVKCDLTGYDLLAALTEYKNDTCIRLVLDKGIHYLPIALKFGTDPEPTITPIWRKHESDKLMTDEDIQEICRQIEARFSEFSIIHKLKNQQTTEA